MPVRNAQPRDGGIDPMRERRLLRQFEAQNPSPYQTNNYQVPLLRQVLGMMRPGPEMYPLINRNILINFQNRSNAIQNMYGQYRGYPRAYQRFASPQSFAGPYIYNRIAQANYKPYNPRWRNNAVETKPAQEEVAPKPLTQKEREEKYERDLEERIKFPEVPDDPAKPLLRAEVEPRYPGMREVRDILKTKGIRARIYEDGRLTIPHGGEVTVRQDPKTGLVEVKTWKAYPRVFKSCEAAANYIVRTCEDKPFSPDQDIPFETQGIFSKVRENFRRVNLEGNKISVFLSGKEYVVTVDEVKDKKDTYLLQCDGRKKEISYKDAPEHVYTMVKTSITLEEAGERPQMVEGRIYMSNSDQTIEGQIQLPVKSFDKFVRVRSRDGTEKDIPAPLIKRLQLPGIEKWWDPQSRCFDTFYAFSSRDGQPLRESTSKIPPGLLKKMPDAEQMLYEVFDELNPNNLSRLVVEGRDASDQLSSLASSLQYTILEKQIQERMGVTGDRYKARADVIKQFVERVKKS